MTVVDDRLKKMTRPTLRALAVEVDQEEEARLAKAEEMGMPFLPRINRRSFIRFLCTECGQDFSVKAEAAIGGRPRCPSRDCQGTKR